MKKTLLTFALLIIVRFVMANGSFSSFFPIENIYNHPDTTVHDLEEDDELMAENDSLFGVPSSEIYASWDTINIHPYKFDITKLNDTTNLDLLNEYSCGYVHPFSGNVTSNFGPRRKRFHYGIDIDLETGDEVYAAFDGKVRIVKKSKSYGNVVVIRHNNGLETFYAHLSKTNVTVGQDVFAGDNIGLGGNTGRSRGSHLHFEVRYMGKPINPNEIICFKDQKLVVDTLSVSKQTFAYIAKAKKYTGVYTNAKGQKVYTVRKGDTLSAIAKRHGTTTSAICKKNGIKSTSILRLGQKIRL